SRFSTLSLHDALPIFLERWLGALEAAEPHTLVHEVHEQLLRVGARLEADLGRRAVLPDTGDRRQCAEQPAGIHVGTLEADRHVVAAVLLLELLDRSVRDLATLRDDAHVVADPFRVLDDVRTEDDRTVRPL